MSDEGNPQAAVVPAPVESVPAHPDAVAEPEIKDAAIANGTDTNAGVETSEPKEVATDAPVEDAVEQSTNDKQPTPDKAAMEDKPATIAEDITMKDDIEPDDAVPAADEPSEAAAADTPSSAGKSKAPRRKSGGVPEHKKKLNKKASKAKMTHTDAKPGDYFYVRLKGYPLWPAIVCDESMLPEPLLKSRPVTAARPDGSYREDYQDGGSKVKDRTFPVMYLHTNEFGWIPNHDLVDLDFDDVANFPASMRKDLASAHLLAAEKHDLDYYKEVLRNFMEAKEADKAAKEAAKAAKKEKKEKRKSKPVVEEDEDEEMPDAPADPESEEAEAVAPEKKASKRKVEDADTLQRSESAKKPKIKLNTPKTTNGTSTPKSAKDPAKATKAKSKKAIPKAAATPEVVAPKEPELTAEEKRAKKEKEILFLRHKLQKGLLTRDQDPKEEEMKQMSEFVSKLEGYAELEVSIIRATKINKVLKAILKLTTIPKEEEFQFKPRSQTLLDKWNKLLASEQGTPSAPATTTNGATTEAKADADADGEADDSKASPTEANGVKEPADEEKVEEKVAPAETCAPEVKDAPAEVEKAPETVVEETPKESVPEPASVESTA